eukprot:CAMPEP_0114690548 /NCGR_PEP_ID=MMETSP0191-20121206/65831_1 /TAXON_ID=126664 /ORGANISM="Sorites sp." /LENGTH=240 /DNA_ID=CAMNT_0001980627 /DNA_START=51 /DNA_END=773 /DNA_ORIENTATION=-
MASASAFALPIASRAFDLASFSNEKVPVVRPGTPISQTTRSPSCQSYVSGEAWDEALRKGVGVAVGVGLPYNWPATPSPSSTYKPCSFAMPPMPQERPEEIARTSLNVNAREFVPFCKMNVHDQMNDVPRSWDEPDYPEAPSKLPSLEICLPWEGYMSKGGDLKAVSECPVVKGPSKGSALHGTGQCKPCAWFWKPRGCSNAGDCSYCHACPAGALKERKKAKVAAIRAGLIEPRGKAQK